MKKPKVWDIAVLTGIALVIIAIIVLRGGSNNALMVSNILIAYFMCVICMLVYAFFRQLKYNMYSYNIIYYMGFTLFTVYVMTSIIMLAVDIVHDPGQYRVMQIVSGLQISGTMFIIISFPFIFLFSLGLFISNIALLKHEGNSFLNIIGMIAAILMTGGAIFLYRANYYSSGSMMQVMRKELVVQLMTSVYLYCECMLIGAIVADLIAAFHRPQYDKDFIIILGCGFRADGTPTPLLKGRIDKALDFYKNQKAATGREAIFIASGGQGPDEPMPESGCIADYLMQNGIDNSKIVQEDKSTDTFENMKFSKEKIEEITGDAGSAAVAFSTTNYHVFRSGLYAKRVKLKAEGMGSDTKWYFWPNAAVREFVGLMTEHRGKQALVLGGMILIFAVLTLLSFV